MTSKKFRRQSGDTDFDVLFSHFAQSSPVKVMRFHFLHQKFTFKIYSNSRLLITQIEIGPGPLSFSNECIICQKHERI